MSKQERIDNLTATCMADDILIAQKDARIAELLAMNEKSDTTLTAQVKRACKADIRIKELEATNADLSQLCANYLNQIKTLEGK